MKKTSAWIGLVFLCSTLTAIASEQNSIFFRDDLNNLSLWKAQGSVGVVSHQETVDQGSDGSPALKIQYEFNDSGGYLILRRHLAKDLPEDYQARFAIRGQDQKGKFELKLFDPSGQNVFWKRFESIEFPKAWQTIQLDRADIGFAWGPDALTPLKKAEDIELVIVADQAAKGTVWLKRLELEDRTYRKTPTVTTLPGTYTVDFNQERKLGGIWIDWQNNIEKNDLEGTFKIDRSLDGTQWERISEISQAGGKTTYVRVPFTGSGDNARSPSLRWIRISRASGNAPLPIAQIRSSSAETGRDRFNFLRAVATDRPRGAYPRYFYGEQPYWTTIPAPLAANQANSQFEGTYALPAILNEDGMIELGAGMISIEPVVRTDSTLSTWASGTERKSSLAQDYLPFPSSTWKTPGNTSGIEVTTTSFSRPSDILPLIYIRYRIINSTEQPQKVALNALIRTIPVNPPWQYEPKSNWMTQGADQLEFNGKRILANRTHSDLAYVLIPLRQSTEKPAQFGAKPFSAGPIYDDLAEGKLPTSQNTFDPEGTPSGVLQFPSFEQALPPGGVRDVFIATLPINIRETTSHQIDQIVTQIGQRTGEFEFVSAKSEWEKRLDQVQISGPAEMSRALNTRKTAISQILANRKGPALEPGPRRYATSWIRDGAVMASALLQNGIDGPARDFALWFARFQREDGFIPCCVTDDRLEPDYIEYDSNGQFLFLIAEIYRYTKDQKFVQALWPKVESSVAFIKKLRGQSMTDEFKNDPEKKAYFGIIPKSVSHEAYLGNPVHSYWDDYWTLRGLKDAIWLAHQMNQNQNEQNWKQLTEEFRESLFASIQKIIQDKNINHIPASGEMFESDATSTAPGLSLLGEENRFPQKALLQTIEDYWQKLNDRIQGKSRGNNYTAYELRMIEPLVRMGEREKAAQVLAFFLNDQRPVQWNQWPEITWKDPTLPTGIGDLPHTWIAAEYLRGLRSVFAYERDEDQSLSLAEGIPMDWLNPSVPIQVQNLPTTYGTLNYTLETQPSGPLTSGVFKTFLGQEKVVKLKVSTAFHLLPSQMMFKAPKGWKIQVVSSSGNPSLSSGQNAVSFTESDFEATLKLVYTPASFK